MSHQEGLQNNLFLFYLHFILILKFIIIIIIVVIFYFFIFSSILACALARIAGGLEHQKNSAGSLGQACYYSHCQEHCPDQMCPSLSDSVAPTKINLPKE
ncbi:unnamed protein product [Pipistrellus nathusii]|uniref:Uncharacterized protein n=1 Tax=Pipistrellus nathusii TaxID=59473 RepID=A0ABP0A2E2_PIPNA